MAITTVPACPISTLRAVELAAGHEPLLQQFFQANPEYFLAVQGELPAPGEAHEEICGELPPGLHYKKKWVIGYLDQHGALAAMANLISDIFVPGVWNVSTFIVATSRYGSGDAQALYKSLEIWAVSNGARWLRLGVVQGYARAERFWSSQGYTETRAREGYQIGKQLNTLRVMYKPMAGGSIDEYLSLVERDRPDLQSVS